VEGREIEAGMQGREEEEEEKGRGGKSRPHGHF